jgi:intracellular septation protein A
MSFWPLLIPATIFTTIGLFFWSIFRDEPQRIQSFNVVGELPNLSRVVSIMMTATVGPREVCVSIVRRKTKLLLGFDKTGCSASLIHLTKAQLKDRKKLEEAFGVICENIAVTSSPYKISGRISGGVEEVSKAVERLARDLLHADEDARLRFEMRAVTGDLVRMGLESRKALKPEHLAEPYPKSATYQNRLLYPFGNALWGCFMVLTIIFLHPLPFILLYHFQGLVAACWFGLMLHVLIALVLWPRRSGSSARRQFSMIFVNSVTTAILYGLTIASLDARYTQLVPTIFAFACAVRAMIALRRNDVWPLDDHKQDFTYEPSERTRIALGVVAICLLAAAVNEAVRHWFLFETWIWYYAYFRLELFVGIFLGSLPGMMPAVDSKIARELQYTNDREAS